jgi:RNA polymerase sigma-70 factor, ECF subfamily
MTRPVIENQTDQSADAGKKTPLSLLQRARAPVRDEVAWNRLVALYQPLVRFWCSRAGIAVPELDDLIQEVFGAVARDISRFRRDRPGDTFRGWLRGVTRNQVLMHFRRNHGRALAEGGSDAYQRLQELPEMSSDHADGEEVEMNQLYHQALEHVRCEFQDPTWQAFWLSAIEGRPTSALVPKQA